MSPLLQSTDNVDKDVYIAILLEALRSAKILMDSIPQGMCPDYIYHDVLNALSFPKPK